MAFVMKRFDANFLTFFLIAAACFYAATAQDLVQPGRYVLDSDTVEVSIEVPRKGLLRNRPIRADFHRVTGDIIVSKEDGGDTNEGTIVIVIDAADLTGNGPTIERVLKGEGFLNVGVYPTMVFSAQGFQASSLDPQLITGTLTMAGQSNTVKFNTQFTGGDAVTTFSFDASGEVQRSEYGMTGYQSVAGETIRVHIVTHFIREDD